MNTSCLPVMVVVEPAEQNASTSGNVGTDLENIPGGSIQLQPSLNITPCGPRTRQENIQTSPSCTTAVCLTNTARAMPLSYCHTHPGKKTTNMKLEHSGKPDNRRVATPVRGARGVNKSRNVKKVEFTNIPKDLSTKLVASRVGRKRKASGDFGGNCGQDQARKFLRFFTPGATYRTFMGGTDKHCTSTSPDHSATLPGYL